MTNEIYVRKWTLGLAYYYQTNKEYFITIISCVCACVCERKRERKHSVYPEKVNQRWVFRWYDNLHIDYTRDFDPKKFDLLIMTFENCLRMLYKKVTKLLSRDY